LKCSRIRADTLARYGTKHAATASPHRRRTRGDRSGGQFRLPKAQEPLRQDRPDLRGFWVHATVSRFIARDLSEKIEKAIIQHCESFTKGNGHCDLCRFGQDWEVKICKDSGLTINQSKVINGESYIVVNYKANSLVKSIWVLWSAEDRFFLPRLANSNARSLNREAAATNIEVIFPAS
jgi:hypothetical protein